MEGNKLSNSYDTIADSDDNDDAGIFSIDNDYTSEAENILVEEENELLVVRTRRTETNQRRVGRGISAGTRSSGLFRTGIHLLRGGPAEKER